MIIFERDCDIIYNEDGLAFHHRTVYQRKRDGSLFIILDHERRNVTRVATYPRDATQYVLD